MRSCPLQRSHGWIKYGLQYTFPLFPKRTWILIWNKYAKSYKNSKTLRLRIIQIHGWMILWTQVQNQTRSSTSVEDQQSSMVNNIIKEIEQPIRIILFKKISRSLKASLDFYACLGLGRIKIYFNFFDLLTGKLKT